MTKNAKKKPFHIVFLITLLVATFLLTGGMKKVDSIEKAYSQLKIFTEIISLVESSYVEEVKPKKLIEGAIQGMLKNLDPHSSYMPPTSYKEMKVDTEGEFGGLGIEITIRDGVLTIVSPIEGTPAYRAGIKAGDLIIKINDKSTRDISLVDAVKKLRGPVNSKVTLTVFRKDLKAPEDFTITRAVIKIRSVWHMKLEDDIGYARVRSFAKTTTDDLKKALKKMSEEKPLKGIVLDLRNNPGGLLKQAVGIADIFLDKGQLVVYTEGRSADQNMKFYTKNKSKYRDVPVVVLVNGGSASASEIVSGALQDLNRAIVLGTKTFGKGSVQTIIPLSEGSGLRLTTAHYYTPSGKVIQDNGVIPNIIIENPSIKDVVNDEKKKDDKKEKDLVHTIFKDEKETGEKEKDEGKEADNKKELKPNNEKEKLFLKAYKHDTQLQRAVELLKGIDLFQEILSKKAS